MKYQAPYLGFDKGLSLAPLAVLFDVYPRSGKISSLLPSLSSLDTPKYATKQVFDYKDAWMV